MYQPQYSRTPLDICIRLYSALQSNITEENNAVICSLIYDIRPCIYAISYQDLINLSYASDNYLLKSEMYRNIPIYKVVQDFKNELDAIVQQSQQSQQSQQLQQLQQLQLPQPPLACQSCQTIQMPEQKPKKGCWPTCVGISCFICIAFVISCIGWSIFAANINSASKS